MFKKLICILSTLVILMSISILPVFAEEATGTELDAPDIDTSNANLWTWRDWETYFSDVDLTQYDFDYLRDVEFNYNFIKFDKTSTSALKGIQTFFFNAEGMYYADKILYSDNCPSYSYSDFAGSLMTRNLGYNETTSKYSTAIGMYYQPNLNSTVNNNVWIISDYDIYKSVASAYPDFKEQIFYCDNPIQSFLDYFDSLLYDYMFYDVYPLKDGYKNIIRFYDSLDCYKAELGFNYYEDNMLNYLNSSVSLKTDLYYTKVDLPSVNNTNQFQHFENINLYIPVDDEFINSHTASEVIDLYMEEVCYAVHFLDGSASFRVWYDKYVKKYLSSSSEPRLVQIKNIAPSSDTNLTVNKTDSTKDCWFIRFQMPNQYTFIENDSDNSAMSGCRTMSTAQLLDLSNGKINNGLNGVGSDIDGADYSEDKERDDLLVDGWKNGYPNTKGNFPYKITVNRNGKVLYEIYFDRKPLIKSNFYTNEQIAYDVDFNLTQGYIYSKSNNCSLEFDFRTLNDDDLLSSDGTFTDHVSDTLKDEVISFYQDICGFFGYSYDSSLTTELIIRFWTNYTGQLKGVYRGYYVQFNWDLENDSNFIKNNSDDIHDYTNDYLEDKPVIDNNGNIHGGAVETPTESPEYNGFNNGDFKFDENTLWDYANSFLGFCARAFKVLPNFIWQLIGCSIVIVIILRIAGR